MSYMLKSGERSGHSTSLLFIERLGARGIFVSILPLKFELCGMQHRPVGTKCLSDCLPHSVLPVQVQKTLQTLKNIFKKVKPNDPKLGHCTLYSDFRGVKRSLVNLPWIFNNLMAKILFINSSENVEVSFVTNAKN